MHAHQCFCIRTDIPFHQCQMGALSGFVAIGHQLEFAVCGLHLAPRHPFYQLFVLAAVLDQIGNRADLELMLFCKFDQVGQPRHLAVVLEDFADDRCRCQSGQLRQIAACLGMPGSHQHTAVLKNERKNMARLHDVRRPRVAIGCRLNGARAVSGGNAGGHARCRFDGQRKVGAKRRTVVAHHQWQIQLLAMLFCQRQADQPTAMPGHEVDHFRRNKFGGKYQVALVLAVFLVHQHDHAPGAYLRDDFLYRCYIGHICACIIRSTYRAIKSTSRLTRLPARKFLRLVISSVCGIKFTLNSFGCPAKSSSAPLTWLMVRLTLLIVIEPLIAINFASACGARTTSFQLSPRSANSMTSPTPSTCPLTRCPPSLSARHRAFSRLTGAPCASSPTVQFSVSRDTSTVNVPAVCSITVRHIPFTAMLSPICTSLKSSALVAITSRSPPLRSAA